MKAYIITYDLKAPGRNYESLFTAIQSSGQWWHFLQSTWIVATNENSQQIWNRLAGHIDTNDYLLIMEVRKESYGWLPQDAWTWISTNVPS